MDSDTVRIVDHDPRWSDLARATIVELHNAVPGVFTKIEHIGSTAVPGLAAKPVIDLMAATPGLVHVPRHEPALARIGFVPHTNGMHDRLLYVRASDGVRTHILHVVTQTSWPTRNQRLLRDHLRRHPEAVERYAALKRTLIAPGIAPQEYTKAKTALIQELTDRARHEHGLPPEPVWEK